MIMEFVALVLCMSIIVQINAAPTPESESKISHKNNEFDLPEIARYGFEMILKVPIAEKFDDVLRGKELKALMLTTNGDENPEISKKCGNNIVAKHTNVCILPMNEVLEVQQNFGKPREKTTLHKVRITAVLDDDTLTLTAFINGNNDWTSEYTRSQIPLAEFNEHKHFSVGGVAGDIQILQFNFTKTN